ncbi:aldehyde dehydrogenase [Amylostereum chailletii]|nr:aldehyde dehydrogenase [Amylostereum chailletii]
MRRSLPTRYWGAVNIPVGSPKTIHRARYAPFVAHESSDPRQEFSVSNPATGGHLCTVAIPTPSDVQRTVVDAQATFDSGVWSRSSAHHRATVLSRLARSLAQRVPVFAEIETLQTGRAIREMQAQLGRLPEWLEYFASLLRTRQDYVAPTQGQLLNYVQRVPLGVVAQITPFNHPLLIAVKKLAPALAAGNSVIVKPSEMAPISVLEFAEMTVEAGLPKGVLSVLPGYGATTGKELVSHPLIRKVDITAGTTTGRALGRVVGANLASFTAELGGKAPIVIFNDADLTSAVNGAAFAAFVASGQTCVSGTRIVVQSGIYDSFMTAFLEKVESITRRMGNPLNPESAMGSVISTRQLERIHDMVEKRKSGSVIAGGTPLQGASELDGFDFSQGSFYPPTVISNISTDDELWKEEVFGPVVVVKSFESEAEGVNLANDCRYGLGAGIWTTDLSRAHRVAEQLQSGLVWVNSHHRNDPSSPWGGMKESGIGRENGVEAFHAYSQSKSVIINTSTVEETRTRDDWFAEGTGARRYG